MDVKILKDFYGYPPSLKGKKELFTKGPAKLAKGYVEQANLIGKGLVEAVADDTEAEPE